MSDEDSGFKVRSQGRLITNPTRPALFKGDVNPGDPGVITMSEQGTWDDDPGDGRCCVCCDCDCKARAMATMLRRLAVVIDEVQRDQIAAIGGGNVKLYHARAEIDALLKELP